MSFIRFFKKSVIISLNKTVIFLRDDRTWSYEITEDLPLVKGLPRKYVDSESEDENDLQKQKQQVQVDNPTTLQILAIEVHEESSLVAVATSDKSLYLFEISDYGRDEQLKPLSRRLISRATNCMKFAKSGEFLIVCDKAGDCYKYDCKEFSKPGRWLLGHMSQILDVLINADESLIITCDRDEKIRVSNHPECHEIKTFCLGHTEFVSHLQLFSYISDSLLLSLSGDKTLRLWDYTKGKECARLELNQPGTKLAMKNLSDDNAIIAVLCHEPTSIAIYKLTSVLSLTGRLIQNITVKTDQVFLAIAINDSTDLLATVLDKDNGKVSMRNFKLNTENNAYTETDSCSMAASLDFNKSLKLPYEDTVISLFKKKFDNIRDYQERKRKRIDSSK